MQRPIFIIGQSGAGKDTLAQNLTKHLEQKGKIIYISTGDELRKFTKEESFTANLARENNQKGHIAPWFVIVGCWFKKLSEDFTGAETLLWNGTPRSVKEFEILSQMLGFYGQHADMIYLKLSDEECRRRIVERQRLEGREETGSEEAINNKLKFFYEGVLPSIELAKQDKNFTVHEIDGEGTREEVFEKTLKSLQV